MMNETTARDLEADSVEIISPISQSAPPPLYQLPVEILISIFNICNSPVVLACITSYLRGIVMGLPGLWNTVMFTHHIPNLELHLERSQDLLLDVSLNVSTVGGAHPTANRIKEFVRLIRPHLHRVRSLDLNYPSSHWFIKPILPIVNREDNTDSFLRPFDTPAPRLESLCLRSGDGDNIVPHNFLARHTPRLRKYQTSGYISKNHLDLPSDGSPIEDLDIDIALPPPFFAPTAGRTVDVLTRFLEIHASSLKVFRLKLPEYFSHYEPRAAFTLPLLEFLTIHGVWPTLLNIVHAPRLCSLELRYDCRIVHRSKGTQTVLRWAFKDGIPTISPFLALHAPSLVTLSLSVTLSHGGQIDDIVPQPPSPCHFPRLRHLILSSNFPEWTDPLVSAIQADLSTLTLIVNGEACALQSVVSIIGQFSLSLTDLNVTTKTADIDVDLGNALRLSLPKLKLLDIRSPAAANLFNHLETSLTDVHEEPDHISNITTPE